jgi:hypothetical protein
MEGLEPRMCSFDHFEKYFSTRQQRRYKAQDHLEVISLDC